MWIYLDYKLDPEVIGKVDGLPNIIREELAAKLAKVLSEKIEVNYDRERFDIRCRLEMWVLNKSEVMMIHELLKSLNLPNYDNVGKAVLNIINGTK